MVVVSSEEVEAELPGRQHLAISVIMEVMVALAVILLFQEHFRVILAVVVVVQPIPQPAAEVLGPTEEAMVVFTLAETLMIGILLQKERLEQVEVEVAARTLQVIHLII
jgi:hypothetical protein